jgi:hypothetical protein
VVARSSEEAVPRSSSFRAERLSEEAPRSLPLSLAPRSFRARLLVRSLPLHATSTWAQ